MKIYKSLKNVDGSYSHLDFIRRGLQLVGLREFNKFYKKYHNSINREGKLPILVDYYFCLLRYGATVCDYFEYRFWEKKNCLRKSYITMWMSRKIQKTFNHGSTEICTNKKMFNEKFSKFHNIKDFYYSSNSTEKEFLDFVIACNRKIIAKPITGFSGLGIHIPDVSTNQNAKDVYIKYKENADFFFEELFIQTGPLAEVNPAAVNTIRIFTLFDGKDVHIMFTGVRFGSGKSCVDNIHDGGFVCEIDKETGIVVNPGYDLTGNKYYYHPVTHKLLLGIQIPQWDKIKHLVKEAALVCPQIGHMAWDIAVSNDKICFIEVNEQGNFDMPQTASQRGYKKDYIEIIKRMHKNGNEEGN